jgi:hypothetical protein
MLPCEYLGTFDVNFDGERFFAVFDAFFTPREGTGRFADVDGGFRMIATTEQFDFTLDGTGTTPFEFKWRGNGELSY